jgi:DevC protein
VTGLEQLGEVHNRRGTKIRFHPDEQIFGKGAAFEPARLYRMTRSKAYLFGGVEIRWTCDPSLIKEKDQTPAKAAFHFPGGLKDYLKASLGDDFQVTREIFAGKSEKQGGHGSLEWAVTWFGGDGFMMVSDQTFLNLFPARQSGAPDHILLQIAPGANPDAVARRLHDLVSDKSLRIRSYAQAGAEDLSYQQTRRPTGIIFGFGVIIGILVGIVIVYQVLSTDVADHLSEYATFKAMGYRQGFFLGIVFEEALILAVLGFVPGFLVAYGLLAGMKAATTLPLAMTSSMAGMVFAGTLVACSLSGAIATRRLASADPADLF